MQQPIKLAMDPSRWWFDSMATLGRWRDSAEEGPSHSISAVLIDLGCVPGSCLRLHLRLGLVHVQLAMGLCLHVQLAMGPLFLSC